MKKIPQKMLKIHILEFFSSLLPKVSLLQMLIKKLQLSYFSRLLGHSVVCSKQVKLVTVNQNIHL